MEKYNEIIELNSEKERDDTMDFSGKVAISTGAASGMGLLFAQEWTRLGGSVVLCDVNEEVLVVKVAEINARYPDKALGVICDVRDYGQVWNGQ